jgi:hypothetical protein
MTSFFQWINELTPSQAWSIFGLCCFLLAILPYLHIIKRVLIIFLTNESTGIMDFSWRMAPSHLLVNNNGIKYYINSDETQFILEGGKIILNWDVKGAYRIDIVGLGKNVKGNTAHVIVRKNNLSYLLIAYTTKGKLYQQLEIDQSLIRNLNTFNISKEVHFNQSNFIHKTFSYASSEYKGLEYVKQKLPKSEGTNLFLTKKMLKKFIPGSMLAFKTNKLFGFAKNINSEKNNLDKRIANQSMSKLYKFNPEKYNEAIYNYNKTLIQKSESYE